MNATIDLIAERGPHGFSIADVADRAGASRGLPVHHFRTRERLLLEVAKTLLEAPDTSLEYGLKPMIDWLRRTLRLSADGSTSAKARSMLIEAGVAPPSVEDHLDAFWMEMRQLALAHLRAALANGSIARLDAETRATTVMGAFRGIIVQAGRGELHHREIDDFCVVIAASFKVPSRKKSRAEQRSSEWRGDLL